MGRYDGKPFLRLIECYVLSSMGELEEQQQSILKEMEPKLRSTYGCSGSWLEIVESQMGFPDSLKYKIGSIWRGYIEYMQEKGLCPDSEAFAKSFVDENLV